MRRRKPGKITAIVQSNATRKAFQKQSRTSNGRDKSDPDSPLLSVDSEQIRGAVKAGATNSWEYTRDVLTIALRLLKKPLAFMVFLFILLLLLAKLASIFRVAFQPLCFIPGVSRSAMCRDPPIFSAEPLRAGYSKLMDVQSTTFDQLLDQSVGGGELSMEIKKAEMATSDLVILVKYSELKSKSLIAKSLEDFVNDAKKTSRGLQKLNAKIGTAVDGFVYRSLFSVLILYGFIYPES